MRYQRSGQRALTPELSHLVDYWRWFHVVQAMQPDQEPGGAIKKGHVRLASCHTGL
jgi:hypothetical protein